MRICLLTQTFPRFENDTAAPFMDGVARGMVETGNNVFVLTPFSPGFRLDNRRLPYKLTTYKYIFPDLLHLLGYSGTLSDDKWLKLTSLILSPFLVLAGIIALYRLVKKEKIDLINAHWILPNGFLAGVVSLITGVPVVSTLPGSDVYMAQSNVFFRLLAKFSARISKEITSNSPQLLADLQKATGEKVLAKSQVIIYGVDPKKFKPRENPFNNNRQKTILGVGRLVAKKGFEYLIKAAPEILRKHRNAVFVIVGDGEQMASLIKSAKKLKVYSKFKFVGSVDYSELPKYYNSADLFVLPSIRDEEGNLDDQSVSVVEAMAAGLPVVTTDFPGYRVVVKDGVNGFLVRQKNVKEIAGAVNKILDTTGLAANLGTSGRKMVDDKFSWQKVGKEYSFLFKEVIDRNKSYFENISKMADLKRRKTVGRQILCVLEKEIGDLSKLKCLDIGCSNGIITNMLADKFREVVGVDMDKPALALAKKGFSKKNLEFIQMNGEALEFGDNSFDVVICNQVYNFVESPQKLMGEIYRVLKPGGSCFFGARNKISLIEPQYNIPFLSFFSGWLPFGKRYMNYWELKKLVKAFRMKDYTMEIIRDPKTYAYQNLYKYRNLGKLISKRLLPFIPNFVWILKKND